MVTYSWLQSVENPRRRMVARIFSMFPSVRSRHISRNLSRGTSFLVIP
ncbi:MAG: hypothetical protein BWX50_00442 [Euryarchaeota archaeon ADurb.Bin009]|nr:MAG: hypothetical protein BWX50_00442 [Euryarchaeota archaeon ADurb.Bin009]